MGSQILCGARARRGQHCCQSAAGDCPSPLPQGRPAFRAPKLPQAISSSLLWGVLGFALLLHSAWGERSCPFLGLPGRSGSFLSQLLCTALLLLGKEELGGHSFSSPAAHLPWGTGCRAAPTGGRGNCSRRSSRSYYLNAPPPGIILAISVPKEKAGSRGLCAGGGDTFHKHGIKVELKSLCGGSRVGSGG